MATDVTDSSAATTPNQKPLRHYGGILKRQGWLVVLVTVLAVGISHEIDTHTTKLWGASMSVLVAQSGGGFQPQVGNQAVTQTMTNILLSDVVAARAIQRADLRMKASDLQAGLAVQVKPSSSILDVTYQSHDQAKTIKVLRSVAVVFKSLIREELGIAGTLRKTGPLSIAADVFDPPHLLPTPISPKPHKDLKYALLLGLGLGLVFAFARESLDGRIRSRREAEEIFGAPVVAVVPRRLPRRPPLEPRPQSRGRRPMRTRRGDSLRFLRASLQLSGDSEEATTIVVGSTEDAAGQARFAASLAAQLALAGESVVCVDADLATPRLQAAFAQVNGGPGMADVVVRNVPLEEALCEITLAGEVEGENALGRLQVMPAGDGSNVVDGDVSPSRVRELIDHISRDATFVVVNAPRLDSAEAVPFTTNADTVLILAEDGKTTRARAEAARDALDRVNVDDGVAVVYAAGPPAIVG